MCVCVYANFVPVIAHCSCFENRNGQREMCGVFVLIGLDMNTVVRMITWEQVTAGNMIREMKEESSSSKERQLGDSI